MPQRFAVIVFFASAAYILYVLFVYPALVALLARIRPRPVRRGMVEKTVSVILPVYNGGSFLEAKLESIFALDYPWELIEVLVLSDGSTDNTDAIARRYAGQGVRLIPLPRGGKARALNRGIAEARNEILLMTDVRQQLEPGSLRRLLECYADAEIGVASGDLVMRAGERSEEADIGLYRRYESWIRARLSASCSMLGATGCFYTIRRDLAQTLPPDTLLDDMYLPLGALFQGYRCILDAEAVCYDYPTALNSEFRRKVRTQAGVYQLIRYRPRLLLPWSATGFHFLSLKLGRLLLPFAFLALFFSSFGLPSPWNILAITAQCGFYALAALDSVVPERLFLKRLTSPFRSFVVLIVSALCAVSIFFRPAATLWTETRVSRMRSSAT